MLKSSYQRSLFRSFLLAGAIPLFICVTLILLIFQLTASSNFRRTAQESLQVLQQTCSDFFSRSEEALTSVASDQRISEALQAGSASGPEIYRRLYRALEIVPSSPSLSLYNADGVLRYTTGNGLPGDRLSPDWGLLFSVREKQGPVFRRSSEYDSETRSVMTIGVPVFNGRTLAGYAVMEISDNCLSELLSGLPDHSVFLLLDPMFQEVFSPPALRESSAASVLRRALLHPGMRDAWLSDHPFFLAKEEQSGFYLALFRDKPLNDRTLQLLYMVAMLAMLLCLLLSLLFSVRLSRHASQPVRVLNEAMEQVENGNLDVCLPPGGTDELSLLSVRFGRMTGQLKENIRRSLEQQHELGETKIRMMQAQLNPHFLYNTLDTLKWLGKIHGAPEVSIISADLADILRRSISADEFQPLREELAMLEHYVEIQKIRFPGKFEYRTEVSPETLDIPIPKLMLQPLVENSIIHGFEDGSAGRITVVSRLESKQLILEVRDNGCGLTPEARKTFLNRRGPRAENRKGHLGLYNVDAILRLNYGEDRGLELLDLQPGTCIRAVIPLSRELPLSDSGGSL